MKPTSRKQANRIFYSVFFASLVFSALYLAWRRGDGLLDFFYQQATNLLGDFSNNLHYPTHEGGPYFDSMWATFPPLAYTLYYLVNVCFTRAIFHVEIVAYFVITGVTIMLMLYAVERIFEQYGRPSTGSGQALLFSLCALLSGVTIYTLERGNSVFNVMVVLLFAIYLRQSKQNWKREVALLLIAFAAGMKIYPALFGLLYVFEKRYREAARLMLYGILLFFIPFAWFGGVDGFKQFLINQESIHLLQRNDFLTSIPSVARFVATELNWSVASASTIGQGLALAFGLVSLACVGLTQTLWKRCLFLVAFAALVPGWSAEYMAVYFIVPCVLFLCDAQTVPRKRNALYAALFGGVLILLPFGTGFALHATVSWNMLVSFASIYILCLAVMADVLVTAIRTLRKSPISA